MNLKKYPTSFFFSLFPIVVKLFFFDYQWFVTIVKWWLKYLLSTFIKI